MLRLQRRHLRSARHRKPILNGANPSNYEEMSKIATEAGVALGVRGANEDELYDTLAALEKLGNKNLLFNACEGTAQGSFRNCCSVP